MATIFEQSEKIIAYLSDKVNDNKSRFLMKLGLGGAEPQQVLPVVCTQGETCSYYSEIYPGRTIRDRMEVYHEQCELL